MCRTWLKRLSIGCAILVFGVTGIGLAILFLNPTLGCFFRSDPVACDSVFINETPYFGSQYPGYLNMGILGREGKIGMPGRTITFRVTLDGYPAPLTCDGSFKYFISDPSWSQVIWANKKCEEQYFTVTGARYAMEGCSNCGTPPLDPSVARLLRHWLQERKITLSDIKMPGWQDAINQTPYPPPSQ